MSYSKGQPLRDVWTSAFANELRALLDQYKRTQRFTVSGPGFVSVGPGGTSLALPRSKGGSGGTAAVAPAPWQPFTTQDGSGNYQANFYPGTLGGILPSNIFSALALSQGAKNYVAAAVTASAGSVTSASLSASTSYPALAASASGSAPTSFTIPIAIFDLTGSKPVLYNIVGFGNLWCQPYVAGLSTVGTGSILSAPYVPQFNWNWGGGE